MSESWLNNKVKRCQRKVRVLVYHRPESLLFDRLLRALTEFVCARGYKGALPRNLLRLLFLPGIKNSLQWYNASMNQVIAAIDQGTTSTRCMIIDHNGSVLGLSQREHHQIYPQPGWVEHDASEIWHNTKQVIQEAIKNAHVQPNAIAAIGITNQRETTVVWDKETGEPLYHAIVWQDARTDTICEALDKKYGQSFFREKTGLPISTYFSAPKLKWLIEQQPNVREAIQKGRALFGTMDTWICWNLTGGTKHGAHITDVTNASRTQLMDLRTLQWDEELLKCFDVPRELLPEIRPSSDKTPYGYTWGDGPFSARIPVCAILGDQQAAMVGQACFLPGEAKNTYGTGCFTLLNTGEKIVHSKNGLVSTVCYQFNDSPPVYALEGSIAMAGSLVQWCRDNLHLIHHASEIEALASTVDNNGDVYFVPAFSGLFAPYWNHGARGLMIGLTGYATSGHIARAILESTAYQTRAVLEAMEADSGIHLTQLKVDGGMVKNNLLMQFQANVLNVPVQRTSTVETTVLGAAYAAGLAVGFWNDLDTMRNNWQCDKEWKPDNEAAICTSYYHRWQEAVKRSFDWA